VGGPPHFWPRGGFGHPIRSVWGGRSHPQGFWGWFTHPQRPPKKKKRNGFGGGRTTPRAWGWLQPPHTDCRGWPKPPIGPWGWFGHLQTHLVFFFFFFWPFGVAGPPPKAWGWLRAPHTSRMGWPKPPLGQKWGGPATPFLGKGWLDFPPT
jgi:hypothetical protein